MSSLHLVDPALAPLLESWPAMELNDASLAAVRSRTLPLPPVGANDVELTVRMVPGPPGAPDIQLHIYRPAAATGALPAIYHIHGGGFILGAASELEAFHRPLVAALQCVLISVDYRLAPETRFPGAIEDCYAGLAYVFAEARGLGIQPSRIGLMGESAGGGLAAALALLARDRGEYDIAFQHLTYPMLDDRTCVGPAHPVAGEFVWTANSNHFAWRALLGEDPGGPNVSCYAAPARATHLDGLPPTYIMTAALDLFVAENLTFADGLLRAGVPTELHLYPGGFHGFDVAPGSAVADRARKDRVDALKRALGVIGKPI